MIFRFSGPQARSLTCAPAPSQPTVLTARLPCAAQPSRFIAVDGKTLKGSFDAFADRKAAHVLGAFAVDHQIILAHEVIDEKSNEIPAAQALIAALGLSDRVFTLDAMHCQKNFRDCPRDRQ